MKILVMSHVVVMKWILCKWISVNLNNINLDDTNYEEDDPDTIILIRFWAWYVKFEKRKALKEKIKEELMTIGWHPKRWWNFSVPEDEKKEIDPIIIEELLKYALLVYKKGVLRFLLSELLKHFEIYQVFMYNFYV